MFPVLLCSVTVCGLHAAADDDRNRDPAAAFQKKLAELADAAAADGMTVRGGDGWLFLRKELRHIGVGRFWGERAAEVSRAARAEHADPLDAIVHYHEQCRKQNIELIVLPIPPKAIIYPDKAGPSLTRELGADPQRLDPAHQQFYELLRNKGVTVIDPTEVLLKHRDDEAGKVYCKQDTHFSGRACIIIADLIARHIKDKPWYDDIIKGAFITETREVKINGDLRRALKTPDMPEETLTLTRVQLGGAPVKPDRDSPVLLLGDSHTLVFHSGGDMHAESSGLFDHLTKALQFRIDLLGVRGSGARPARIALYRRGKADAYLENKKIIIWAFAAREFTEARGWGRIPLKR